ncbi:MAG: type IV pilus biogenesis protein PilM [Dehalococcoidales bacterium]
MAGRVVTLEISSTDIRLMETEGRKVIKWASLSLGPGMFEEEVISDLQALSAAVKQLLTSSGIRAKDIIASIGGLYSLSRVVLVPSPPGGTTPQQAVLEAAREVVPISEEELYFSWQTIASVEGGQQVLVVSVPRDVIDAEVHALRMAGVNPRVMDLKAMALIRAVNREQALILNIEPTSFDIALVVGGVVEVMRTTAWRPGDLSAEDKVEHLAVNLELTEGFYDSHHPGFPLDPAIPLFVTGQMSGDLSLMETLRARVKYPIEPLAPPLDYPAHLPVSQYAVNIGLALKGMAPSKSAESGGFVPPNINLLPEIYQPWKPSAKQVYLVCSIIAAIALLFPVYQLTSEAMGKTADLKTKYTIINSELQRRQAEIKNREPLQKAISEYRAIVDMGGGFTENLKVINSQAGGLGIGIQSITHEGGSIIVICQADNYTAFRDYLNALEESGRFTTPIPPPEGYPYTTGGTIRLEPRTGK